IKLPTLELIVQSMAIEQGAVLMVGRWVLRLLSSIVALCGGMHPRRAAANRSNRQRISNAQVVDNKAMPRGKDLGDAAAVADPPVGLVAQQTARGLRRGRGGLLQRQFGFAAAELLFDDAPEARPVAPAVGLAPLGRRAERLE